MQLISKIINWTEEKISIESSNYSDEKDKVGIGVARLY